MTITWRLSISGLTALIVASNIALAQDRIMGIASVIDGDTIEVRGQKIRLHGIDAPESSQLCTSANGQRWRCGQQASFALADHIGRSNIICRRRNKDRYGRIIEVCFMGKENLNRWMVATGWAVAYRHYSRDYVAIEQQAQRAGKNIWPGTFEKPWKWRAMRRNR